MAGPRRRYDIRLIGPPTLIAEGGPVTLARRRTLAAAAYVLVENRRVSRTVLASMLWPDSERSLANLRTVLTELRQRLPGLFVVERDHVRPNAECPYDLDVHALERLAATGDPTEPRSGRARPPAGVIADLVGAGAGTLLEGVALDDSEAFSWWLDVQRQRVERHRGAARRLLAAEHLEHGHLDQAIEVLTADAAEAIYDEAVHGELVRLLVKAGRRTEAVRHAESFQHRLLEDIGVAVEIGLGMDGDATDEQHGSRPPGGADEDVEPIVGRSQDIERLATVLQRARLVTVVGPGGVGKSRLVREVARRGPDPRDGVAFVELRDIVDPSGVAHAVAAALRLSLGPGRVADQVADYVSDLDLFVVLDGAEAVVDGVADLVERIFARSRHAHVLVTSRCALDLLGEVAIEIGPMDREDARALFLARAGPAVVRPPLDDVVVDAIDRLCHSVDRLPLAIEVVAAQAAALDLGASFDDAAASMSPSWADPTLVDLDPVAEVVDWSVRLQRSTAREVFTSLGVFAGPFDLAAVAAVSGLDRDVVAGALAELVAHSLVAPVSRVGDATRWQLLQVVANRSRQLAGPSLPALAERHAVHFHDRVSGLDLFDLRDADLVAAMAPDLENYALAHDRLARAGRWNDATEIAIGCYGVFATYGWTRRGREWLERCLQHGDCLAPTIAEGARGALVQLCLVLDDAAGVEHHGRLLADAIDPRIRAEATGTRALPILQTQPERAQQLLDACVRALDHRSPAGSWIWPRAYLGFAAMYEGDLGRALRHLDASTQEALALGHTSHLWILEDAAASCELLLGAPHAVLQRLSGGRRPDTFWDASRLLTGLARLALDDVDGGREDLLEFANPAERRRLPRSANDALVGLAALAAAEGRRELALDILGTAGRGRMPASIGVGRRLAARLGGTAHVEQLRRQLEADGRLYASADELLARQWHAARARADGL